MEIVNYLFLVFSVGQRLHRLLCFKKKFLNQFAFTFGRYFFLLFLAKLFNVDVNYSFIYLVKLYFLPKLY